MLQSRLFELERRNPLPGRCRAIHDATECELGCNPRYVAFLRAGYADCRGKGSMHPFLNWSHWMLRSFERETGVHPSYVPRYYESWLDSRTQRKAGCMECFGDGNWHGRTCGFCHGTGEVLDNCHPVSTDLSRHACAFVGGVA